MSEHTKRHHTNHDEKKPGFTVMVSEDGHVFSVPEKVFNSYIEKFEIKDKTAAEKTKAQVRWGSGINPGEAFAELNEKYSKLGALVKGVRHREGLSQNEFSKRLGISQSDLSKIECGKRAIGKNIANRIIKEFNLRAGVFG